MKLGWRSAITVFLTFLCSALTTCSRFRKLINGSLDEKVTVFDQELCSIQLTEHGYVRMRWNDGKPLRF